MDSDLRSLIMASRPSVVLSEARASLLNPSRPQTPLQTTRRRFDFETGNVGFAASKHESSPVAETRSAPPSRSSLRRKMFMDARAEDEDSKEPQSPLESDNISAEIYSKEKKPKTKAKARGSRFLQRTTFATQKSTHTTQIEPNKQHGLGKEEAKEAKEEEDSVVGSARALLGENTAKEVLREVREKLAHLGNCAGTVLSEGCAEVWSKLDQVCSFAERENWVLKDDVEVLCRYGLQELCAAVYRSQEEGDLLATIRLCRLCIRLAACDKKGPNDKLLEQVCEIVYAVASEKAHDDLIRTEKLLETIVLFLLPATVSDGKMNDFLSRARVKRALTFALGSLKFVSQENTENQQALATTGVVSRLANLISLVVDDQQGASVKDSKQDLAVRSQILIEASALLRSMVDDKRRVQQVFTAGVPALLNDVLSQFPAEPELSFNCVRILSKLSTSAKGRSMIDIPTLLLVLRHHYRSHLGVCVRACFILGNMTTSNNKNRQVLAGDDMEGMHLMVKIFSHHAKHFAGAKGSERPKRDKEREDVLTKVIRVIANISIDEDTGVNLICQKSIPMVYDILKRVTLDSELEHDKQLSAKQEELALNAIAFITNLSFYETPSMEDGILQRKDVVEVLLPYLFSGNHEAALEAVRALGNFSRSQFMQKCMNHFRVDEAMTILLDHHSRDVVLGACGVLTNLVSNRDTRKLLVRLDTISRFIAMLRRSGVSDPELSARVCMVLHNFLTVANAQEKQKTIVAEDSVLESSLEELLDIAVELQNEEHSDSGDEDDHQATAENMSHFINVAESLLAELRSIVSRRKK